MITAFWTCYQENRYNSSGFIPFTQFKRQLIENLYGKARRGQILIQQDEMSIDPGI